VDGRSEPPDEGGPAEIDLEIRIDDEPAGRQVFAPTYQRFNPRGPIPACGPGCLATEARLVLARP
jgi:hypothetical protein